MDLAALKKKSILIPTPGQTEQEYLAKHLMKNNFALCVDQKKFRLKNALELGGQFNYQIRNFSLENNLDPALENLLTTIRNRANGSRISSI
jgi:UDP-N-acetylglucosamine:LPS N-acetylglucosamine transferase